MMLHYERVKSDLAQAEKTIKQDIIADNHFNSKPPITTSTGSYDWLNGSYIAFVEEEDFLSNPKKYIDNAYEKSENDGKGYDLTVTEA